MVYTGGRSSEDRCSTNRTGPRGLEWEVARRLQCFLASELMNMHRNHRRERIRCEPLTSGPDASVGELSAGAAHGINHE